MKYEVISRIKTLLFAIVFAVFINSCIIVRVEVPTETMENTIMTDNRIVALRILYLMEDPKGGDNREASVDSRDWGNHYVKKDKILGKVLF